MWVLMLASVPVSVPRLAQVWVLELVLVWASVLVPAYLKPT